MAEVKIKTPDGNNHVSLTTANASSNLTLKFPTTAGSSGIALSGSTNALLADFYRTESNYKSSLARNLDINVSQFERNLEAIQFGQEAQSTYVQPPNSAMLFASAVGNVANTYYSMEMQKENLGLLTNQQKKKYG